MFDLPQFCLPHCKMMWNHVKNHHEPEPDRQTPGICTIFRPNLPLEVWILAAGPQQTFRRDWQTRSPRSRVEKIPRKRGGAIPRLDFFSCPGDGSPFWQKMFWNQFWQHAHHFIYFMVSVYSDKVCVGPHFVVTVFTEPDVAWTAGRPREFAWHLRKSGWLDEQRGVRHCMAM